MKTDPEHADYSMEQGASRNYEPWREKDREVAEAVAAREEEEKGNAMKACITTSFLGTLCSHSHFSKRYRMGPVAGSCSKQGCFVALRQGLHCSVKCAGRAGVALLHAGGFSWHAKSAGCNEKVGLCRRWRTGRWTASARWIS